MSHPVVEDHLKDAIDICALRRDGLLDGGRYRLAGGIRYPKIASMVIDPTCIQIVFTNGQQQTFSISWAQEFPATRRPWIVCPSCRKRFAHLYRTWTGYQCRACSDLWFRCQTLHTPKRQRLRITKIASEIDGRPIQIASTVTFPKRPKGKHRKRYFQLRGIAADIEAKLAMRGRASLNSR